MLNLDVDVNVDVEKSHSSLERPVESNGIGTFTKPHSYSLSV